MAGGVRVRLSLRANCACAGIGPLSTLLIGMRARRPANARNSPVGKRLRAVERSKVTASAKPE